MNLTKLEVFGFKSFAQKAIFKFDDGLTGIIGPNGCGKSNIVDAIRWVLGEQRARVLRCDRMENLIFNGTATRKPLGLAEISMFIENNRDILPSEYSEIKITRRLYRSGESEYLINNQNVRLMDITNLFTDTGMGADAYSVIELKMVEQILSDNAQERRHLFEEASGIKKYKARRRSAMNKLDTTEQELTRLDDIISEVQKAVNSLSRQVGKARRYHEYKGALKENELLLAYLRIHAYQNNLKPLQTEIEQVRKSKETLGKEVHTYEADLEKLKAESVTTEQSYRQKAAALYKRDEEIREQQGRRQLRQQRIESLEEAIKAFHNDINVQQGKIEQLGSEKEQLTSQIDEIRRKMNDAQEQYRDSANLQLQAEMKYQNIRDEYQNYIQSNLEELQSSGELKEDHQKILIEKESLVEQVNRNKSTLQRFENDFRQRQNELNAAAAVLSEAREETQMYEQEQAHLEKTIQQLKENQDELRDTLNSEAGKLEKLSNRRDFLENLINNYEGFSQSVQYVMSQKGRFGGVVDTLANLVDCQEEYRTALESYLAEVANYVIVEDVDQARNILKDLRSENKGRVTVIPLPLLEANQNGDPAALPANNGAVRPLSEVVSYPDRLNRLFDFLFSRVYLVPDIETAITLRASHPHLTYVTSDGEILENWGNLTGGAPSRQVGLVGRKEQYQRVLENIESLEKSLSEKRQKLSDIREDLEKRETKLQEFSGLLKESQQRLVSAEKTVDNRTFESNRLQETIDELNERLSTQNDRLHQLNEQETKLLPQLKALGEKVEAYKAQEQNLLEQQRTSEAALKELTRTTQEKQITYLNQSAQEKELQQRNEFAVRGIREAEQYIVERKKKVELNQSQIVQLKEEIEDISSGLEAAYQQRDSAESEKDETERHFQEFRTQIQNAEGELKKRQRLWNQARERLQELELRIKELQVKMSGLEEQVKEHHGEEALTFDIQTIDPSLTVNDVQQTIEDLRLKLERLGDVNPLAIKEYDKEKERLDFLLSQRDDLLSAREQLMETIQKLNNTARKQFMETFERIQVNFQRVFQEFFSGGKAELKLIESRDPLEANIDIGVTHKGKKLTTLTLLSAGEKTLTAISLLFAIYLVKPSPFCILDEVDAPLDDVNIDRLMKALQLFARDTQFILVTHNKKTMEATNSIYGVTMEEQGVSKVVSVKFN